MIVVDGYKYITAKMIQAGDVIEIYEYENGYSKGYVLSEAEKSNRGRIKGMKSENYHDNRAKVLTRAKNRLRRLINANVGAYGQEFTSKFVTLTFGENITDLDTAHYEFKKFLKRLNYAMYGTKKANLRYSVVVEFQSRGAVHYHVLFYNLPYLKSDRLAEIWGNGFIKINKIDDVDNVGAYVTKYMSKDLGDERLRGRKCYFNSRDLKQPVEITEKEKVEAVAVALPSETLKYTAEFDNEHLGNIRYRQYNLNFKTF